MGVLQLQECEEHDRGVGGAGRLVCACAGTRSGAAVAEAASGAAREGALQTRDMAGRGGRAGYVNPDMLKGVPDPGAYAVAEWMGAIVRGLK